MTWVFQGTPDRYDVDDYLSRYPQLIYWRTNRYRGEIEVGDRAFIWRAGTTAGAVAIGHVVEPPTRAQDVRFPEALGDDLWVSDEASPEEVKTGIRIEELRLTPEDGMVLRDAVKADHILAESTLIRMPNSTIFHLSDEEKFAMEALWFGIRPGEPGAAALEGHRRIQSHFVRERSPRLRRDKLEAFRREHGGLRCEICGFCRAADYPEPMTERAFEVHHRLPLSKASAPVRTTLQDLAVLCANCHRTVHSTGNVEINFTTLQDFHRERR